MKIQKVELRMKFEDLLQTELPATQDQNPSLEAEALLRELSRNRFQ